MVERDLNTILLTDDNFSKHQPVIDSSLIHLQIVSIFHSFTVVALISVIFINKSDRNVGYLYS